MSLTLIPVLALLGVLGGFSAGLLGFGGGVIMFPLLFYVPPLLGMATLEAKTVAALVVSQVFFSTLVGGVAHFRSQRVHWRIASVAGGISAVGAFAGGVASPWVSERFLLLLFAIVTLLVGLMMFLPSPTEAQETVPVSRVRVALFPLSLCSSVAGVVVGFLGAGNFIFVPLLIYIMKVPTRISIACSLFIAMMNTTFGFLGKLVTGQIPLTLALAVVTGATLGAVAGEKIHGRLSPSVLRHIYAAMVSAITIRVWMTLLGFDQ
jgi:uncharacterized membrane protein YfcA